MKRSAVLGSAALLLGLNPAFASDDLESLFDNATTKSSGKQAEKSAPQNALSGVLRAELPRATPEQYHFINLIAENSWDRALLHYPQAFDRSDFAKSANGQALFALAHWRAGLHVAGLERLFAVVKPQDIHLEIRRLWQESAPADHPAWAIAKIKWNPGFATLFSPEVEYQIEAAAALTGQEEAKWIELYGKWPSTSASRARVGWHLMIHYARTDRVTEAATLLAQLMKAPVKPVSEELMNLTAARLLYQRGHFEPAIRYYKKISRQSEFWPEAQEEMAWGYIRRGQAQDAAAIGRSLTADAIVPQTSAESFFVHSLAQLKLCDYAGVIETLKSFPKYYRKRVQNLEKLTALSESPEVGRLIIKLRGGRINRRMVGPDGAVLPRMIARDERAYQLAQAYRALDAEAKAADVIYSKSMAETGLQGYFEKVRAEALARAHAATAAVHGRVSQLAKKEAESIHEILRKLHIVEAEVIQQISLARRVAANTKRPVTVAKGQTGSDARDVLVFPAKDGDDLWFDEIGNFRVDVKKNCHVKGKGSTQ